MKEPCGAIKERRLIRSRIQHRRQNLFHTSRKFKTKQNPINWKKYNANLWRNFPKCYVVAMSAVWEGEKLRVQRDSSSEWFYRRNWSRAIASNDAVWKSSSGREIRTGPTPLRAMTLCGSQRAAEEKYSGRAVTRWNPGLFSQPLDLITRWNTVVLFFIIIFFNVFSSARKKE